MFHSSLSPWRKSSSQSILFKHEIVPAWVGSMWAKWNCSSYPFQGSCSWLCAALGCCNFLIGFWNSHKKYFGPYTVVKLVGFSLREQGLGLPISLSCWHYLWISSFKTTSSEVSQNTYLKLNVYSFAIRPGCNGSWEVKSLWLAAICPTKNRVSSIKEEGEKRFICKNLLMKRVVCFPSKTYRKYL